MIQIKSRPTADTRTCDVSKVTKAILLESSNRHIEDVGSAMSFFVERMRHSGERHDYDKVSDISSFHHDFATGFAETKWWDKHRRISRHHLNMADGVPENVNLIDVIEYVADCVMAGMARSGEVTPLDISATVLRRACENTAELLIKNVEVVENEDETTP